MFCACLCSCLVVCVYVLLFVFIFWCVYLSSCVCLSFCVAPWCGLGVYITTAPAYCRHHCVLLLLLLCAATPTVFLHTQGHKVYVQQRLRETSTRVWELLEQGAHFYVCGDAGSMAGTQHSGGAMRYAVGWRCPAHTLWWTPGGGGIHCVETRSLFHAQPRWKRRCWRLCVSTRGVGWRRQRHTWTPCVLQNATNVTFGDDHIYHDWHTIVGFSYNLRKSMRTCKRLLVTVYCQPKGALCFGTFNIYMNREQRRANRDPGCYKKI